MKLHQLLSFTLIVAVKQTASILMQGVCSTVTTADVCFRSRQA